MRRAGRACPRPPRHVAAILRGGLRPALFFFAGGAVLSVAAAAPAIRWLAAPNPAGVEVIDVPARLLRGRLGDLLTVVVDQPAGHAVMPSIAGTFRAVEGALHFEPRFPWAQGVTYRAEFHAPGAAPIVSHFQLPPRDTAPTTFVQQVYPSADELPENQLKFYVHFSAPMSRGALQDRVQLTVAGRAVELPFLELDEELWDPSMTRLTLLIDPGRIKRGVKPLEDIGPVFEAGQRYELLIAADCRDAEGRPLRSEFRKTFRAIAADRTPPDPQRWQVHSPAAGSREPLRVTFDEPMDHALALRLITVVSPTGQTMAGGAGLGQHERDWTFTPAQPWARGRHRLTIATTIEDLAGNNIGKVFDVDLFEGVQRKIETPTVELPFEVR